MTDELAANYLRPLADHDAVERIEIVRHKAIWRLESPKLQHHIVDEAHRPQRFAKMLAECRKLTGLDAWVSFNPLPYGLIELASSFGRGVPYHLGFIGRDWYGKRESRAWKVLKPIIRGADFITATGENMRQGLIDAGADPGRAAILPHSIDLERFTVADPAAAEFDAVFVGQMIPRKRVDLILRAASEAGRILGRPLRVCLVGDGPTFEEMKVLARELGVAESTHFVGHSDEVERHVKNARICLMASDGEGFPFAMVESMCCGLVPVSTEVGTIGDTVTDGESGILVEPGDWRGLGEGLARLVNDEALYDQMRARVLETRAHYSFSYAVEVWDGWLTELATRKR